MKVVTSGSAYVDIDAYADIVAYAELLQKQGKEAIAATTAPLNESITKTIRSWPASVEKKHIPRQDDAFILVDVSEPEYFDGIVNLEHVEEVLDHHLGFEDYWQKRIGTKAKIEFIGAACTLVYEQWKRAGLLESISETSARLLLCGILDNTLNFGAKVTMQRDRDAYTALLAKAHVAADWAEQYFIECQEAILNDIAVAIQNDKKVIAFASFDQPVAVGQLAVWDAQSILKDHQVTISQALAAIKPRWFMNLINVSEGKSYLITENPQVKAWLSALLEIQFDGSVAISNRLWLRKEIMKQDMLFKM